MLVATSQRSGTYLEIASARFWFYCFTYITFVCNPISLQMACLASMPCPLRVYDHEYVETIDSGGRCESPLMAGERVNLWHDASFEIRYKSNQIITVSMKR